LSLVAVLASCAIKFKDRIRTISAQRRKACPERGRRVRQEDAQCSRKSANLRCLAMAHPTSRLFFTGFGLAFHLRSYLIWYRALQRSTRRALRQRSERQSDRPVRFPSTCPPTTTGVAGASRDDSSADDDCPGVHARPRPLEHWFVREQNRREEGQSKCPASRTGEDR
jgi:hypothetical protein